MPKVHDSINIERNLLEEPQEASLRESSKAKKESEWRGLYPIGHTYEQNSQSQTGSSSGANLLELVLATYTPLTGHKGPS